MNHKYSGPLGQGIDKINTTACTEHYNKNFKILEWTEPRRHEKTEKTEGQSYILRWLSHLKIWFENKLF